MTERKKERKKTLLRSTLNIIFSVTYYLELHNLYLFIVYLIFYQQMLNWLFGHYKILTTLFDKNI